VSSSADHRVEHPRRPRADAAVPRLAATMRRHAERAGDGRT
jgi:hypothetical protein